MGGDFIIGLLTGQGLEGEGLEGSLYRLSDNACQKYAILLPTNSQGIFEYLLDYL